MNFKVQYLDTQRAFTAALEKLNDIQWMGFDTEFVGEKSYIPVLCLLQIVTEHEILLVDTLQVRDISAFLTLVENPDILKITHAGDNDYRLLYNLYGTVPQNTFDTQIAAGFVGYNYPAGFGKIVERELGVSLAKSHTVADWEARPLDPKAVEYAVEDVKYLPALHHRLSNKLQRRKRENWAREENRKWENVSFYFVDPNKEVMGSDFIHQLDFRDKVFLARLYQWRRDRAAEWNIPKETVLQARHISTVVKSLRDGQQAFRANRTLPEGIWRKYQKEWLDLRAVPVSDEERKFINSLPAPVPDDPDTEWAMELLYHFVKKQCLEHEISAALLLPRGEFNKLKSGEVTDPNLLSGWRAELLGKQLTEWLINPGDMRLEWAESTCTIRMNQA